jgi:hypothetical protein
MLSKHRGVLKKIGWRQKINLNLDLTEYDATLDTIIEKHASVNDLKNLCDIFNLEFYKDDLEKTKTELLIVFHNEPGLSALVVAPILLGMGLYLMSGSIFTASIVAKLVGLKTMFVGDKILNLSSKYSEDNIKKCRAIIAHILSTMPKKTVVKEITTVVEASPTKASPTAKTAKTAGTRKRTRRR